MSYTNTGYRSTDVLTRKESGSLSTDVLVTEQVDGVTREPAYGREIVSTGTNTILGWGKMDGPAVEARYIERGELVGPEILIPESAAQLLDLRHMTI